MNTLSPGSWLRLRVLLERALELDDGPRAAYIAALEGDDEALRPDLMRLLVDHEGLGQQSIPNAFERVTPVIADALHEEMALDDTRVGQMIGPYRLIRLLGAGGMGAVYLAERCDEGFSQQVALKVVRQALASATALERFERERQILATLKYPGIALLFDGGRTADGQAFYTMEYVDGQPVTDYCVAKLDSVESRVSVLLQIAAALASAHRNLIVHRDIKPSNVLVNADGQVKLVDFGLAKLLDNPTLPTMTQAGLGPMTPAYAAPEQFLNGVIAVATDIYQFGVLSFMILTGRLPYRPDPADSLAWARAVTEEEPMTLSRAVEMSAETTSKTPASARYKRHLTRDLDAILCKAMAKEPERRYGSMDAMITDLRAFLDGGPIAARRAGPAYFAWRFALRHRVGVAAAILAFTALGATALVAVRQSGFAAAEAARATAVADFLVSLFRVSDPGVNRGERLNANQILEQGAQRIDREMASHPEQQARLQAVIGEVYATMGDFPKAQAAFEPAIATLKTTPSTDPVDLAHALSWKAYIAIIQGDLKGALKILDEAQAMLDGSTPRQREELGTLHGRRAAAFDYLGDYDLARGEYATALKLRAEIGQENTVKTAGLHNNLGNLLRSTNDLDGAQAEYNRAIAIYRVLYGADSGREYALIGASMNLGMALIDLDKLQEARELLSNASRFFAGMDVPSNLGYANAENKLGEIDRLERKFDDATIHYANSERAYRAVLGEHHHSVALPIQNRGQAELERGNFDGALELFEKALALRLESLPRMHREVATSLDGRGQVRLALKQYEAAKQDAEEALAIWQKTLPADHPLIVYSLLHVGLTRLALADDEGARAVWEDALVRAPRAFTDNPARRNRIRHAIDQPDISLSNLVPAGSYDE